MRTGLPVVVEARIARADVKALAEGLQGGGAAYRHEVVVTKAMSVRLRAPEGGFWIEPRSPETQWIENVLGLPADDFASWRWTVTPRERGKRQLQLIISARTVGGDGLTAETALPDQVIDVKVGINYGRTAARWLGWAAAAVIGGVFARFGDGAFDTARALLTKIMAG
jgi:neural Wiskott-Aldrich syndrome protein